MKIAIFGSCIPNGVVSMFNPQGGEKISKPVRKHLSYFSLIENLKRKYINVHNYAHSMSGMSYIGCGIPEDDSEYNYELCTGYQIMNCNLKDYDVIILICNVSDYKNCVKSDFGEENDNSLQTINGAWNLILNKLKDECSNKKIFFFLPLYLKQVKGNVTFKEFELFLINKIKSFGFKYFSFYNYLSSFINIEDNEKFLFPDGYHPSFDVNKLFVEYVMNILEKEIKE